ncbi:MAG: bacillithiol biosynthesis cysteine-adding enzyme BshC [Bacteroidota bacterium]
MMQHTEIIGLDEWLSLPKVLHSLKNHDPEIMPLIEAYPDKASITASAARKLSFEHRDVLCNVLLEQYAQTANNAPALRQIEKLKQPTTCTVTSGQQLCFAGGPLMVFIKAAQTIALAKHVEHVHGLQVVPVFWMASEDHDQAEVATMSLFGKSYTTDSAAAKNLVPVGKLDVADCSSLLETLSDPALRIPSPIVDMVKACYAPQNTYAKAFRELLHRIFGADGLLMLDADDARLKRIFLPQIKQELTAQVSYHAVEETCYSEKYGQFIGKGNMQATPRSINLFYIRDGKRLRIEKTENGFKDELGDFYNFQEMMNEADEHPERFSPGVLLRPLYQECILPNLAYVGGRAEMMYWLQLGSLFRKMGMHMPFLILRNSLFLLKEPQWQKWKEKGFAPKDIFLGREDIEKKYATLASEGFSVEDAQAKISAIYASLIQRVSEIDTSLSGMAEAEKTKHLTALKQLETRVMRAVKQKEETGLRQVLKIKDHLFPNGAMMERSEAGILYAEDGMSHLIDIHKEHLSPFGFGAVLVVEGVEKNDS